MGSRFTTLPRLAFGAFSGSCDAGHSCFAPRCNRGVLGGRATPRTAGRHRLSCGFGRPVRAAIVPFPGGRAAGDRPTTGPADREDASRGTSQGASGVEQPEVREGPVARRSCCVPWPPGPHGPAVPSHGSGTRGRRRPRGRRPGRREPDGTVEPVPGGRRPGGRAGSVSRSPAPADRTAGIGDPWEQRAAAQLSSPATCTNARTLRRGRAGSPPWCGPRPVDRRRTGSSRVMSCHRIRGVSVPLLTR
jgi:hypothetical protein